VDDKAPEGSAGALWSERARATLFACPDVVEGSIAINSATIVEELASRTEIAIVFRFVDKTIGTEVGTPLSVNTVAGSHIGSDVTIGQPLQELPVPIRRVSRHRFGRSSLPLGETGEHVLRGHGFLTHARRRGLHSHNHTACIVHQIVVVVAQPSWRAALGGIGSTGDCTLLGSKLGCGTVFELSPPATEGGAWTETILYSFPTAKQGYEPNGDLVFDSVGNLYGATMFGGGKGTTCDSFYGGNCGAEFKLSPSKKKGGAWAEKVLHSFAGGTDGANPNGGLVLDGKGNVYGTTYGGGNESGECGSGGCGTAFELKPPTKKFGPWAEKQLHVFAGGSDGERPAAGMIFDAGGRLYGTTFSGGTIFSLTPPAQESQKWRKAILYSFNESDGPFDPEGTLIFDQGGNLYGTTYVGNGATLQGGVFQLRPPQKKGGSWGLHIVHGFLGPPDGDFPAASLVFNANGDLYSTTQAGGTGTGCGDGGCGTVFEVSP